MVRKALWLFGLIILLAIIVGTSLFAYQSYMEPEKYTVVNKNAHFTIQKSHPDVFVYYLHEWRVFGNGGITHATPSGKHTVKTVAVALTNEVQKSYSISAKGDSANILMGASSSVEGDTLYINVYIAKDASIFSDDILNKNLIFIVMSAIFDATGNNGNDASLIAAIDAFYKDPNIRPFVIKSK